MSDLAMGGEAPLITNDAALARACNRWGQASEIGLDTEFVRERTYYPRPGLIQVADRLGVLLVDPLAVSNFAPLAKVLVDPAITKLAHACDEDLDVLELVTGVTPVNVFDTQLAGAFVGHGFSPSYASLVHTLLDVVLDKGLTRSDWCHRPLSSAQRHYAALDVVYLSGLRDRLSRELATLGRSQWFDDEGALRRHARTLSKQPQQAFTRLRRRGGLSPSQHAVLRALSEWRETEAMARDIPRRHVVPDDVLVALALPPDLDASLLEGIDGLSERARTRYGKVMVERADRARARGPEAVDVCINLRPHADLLSDLKDIVRAKATTYELPQELLASRRVLESLVVGMLHGDRSIPRELEGWRFDVVTGALLSRIESVSVSR